MPGPVSDLQTNSPDNSTLVISWRPPTTPNGNIISYSIIINDLRDGTTLRDIMDHSAAMTSLTESGLGTYKMNLIGNNNSSLIVHSSWGSILCECCSSESSRSRKCRNNH